MGMYTELVLKVEVKKQLPPEVEEVLQFLFNGGPKPELTPNHPFFDTERWTHIGNMSSYYHTPWTTSKYKESYIFSRSDLKNYNGEIGKFIDWLRPYLGKYQGDCLGWEWYEEEEMPTLITRR